MPCLATTGVGAAPAALAAVVMIAVAVVLLTVARRGRRAGRSPALLSALAVLVLAGAVVPAGAAPARAGTAECDGGAAVADPGRPARAVLGTARTPAVAEAGQGTVPAAQTVDPAAPAGQAGPEAAEVPAEVPTDEVADPSGPGPADDQGAAASYTLTFPDEQPSHGFFPEHFTERYRLVLSHLSGAGGDPVRIVVPDQEDGHWRGAALLDADGAAAADVVTDRSGPATVFTVSDLPTAASPARTFQLLLQYDTDTWDRTTSPQGVTVDRVATTLTARLEGTERTASLPIGGVVTLSPRFEDDED